MHRLLHFLYKYLNLAFNQTAGENVNLCLIHIRQQSTKMIASAAAKHYVAFLKISFSMCDSVNQKQIYYTGVEGKLQ